MLVAPHAHEDGCRLARSLAAAWPFPTPPHFTVDAHRDLHSKLIEHADAMVIDISQESPPSDVVLELLALREMGLPMIVLGNDAGTSGALCEHDLLHIDRNTDPEVITGALLGIAHRQGEVASLLHETGRSRQQIHQLDRQLDRLNMELEDASRLQRDNLPSPVQNIHGGSIGTLWKPAGVVSGDLVTVLDLGEQRTALLVADAIGHGVPAAILSMMIQRTIMEAYNGQSRSLLWSPSQTLKRLNESLLQQAGTDTRFATAIYAVYDGATNHLHVGAAGHPAPIVARADGSTRRLAAQGPLLGIFADETYVESSCQLRPGDRMVLYSDGIEQASLCTMQNSGATGQVAIEQLVREIADAGNPATFIERMKESLELDATRRTTDDMDDLTMLCLYVDEASGASTRTAA